MSLQHSFGGLFGNRYRGGIRLTVEDELNFEVAGDFFPHQPKNGTAEAARNPPAGSQDRAPAGLFERKAWSGLFRRGKKRGCRWKGDGRSTPRAGHESAPCVRQVECNQGAHASQPRLAGQKDPSVSAPKGRWCSFLFPHQKTDIWKTSVQLGASSGDRSTRGGPRRIFERIIGHWEWRIVAPIYHFSADAFRHRIHRRPLLRLNDGALSPPLGAPNRSRAPIRGGGVKQH